jgi:hypothetical protein
MRKTYAPLTVQELADYNKLVDSPNKINPSSIFFVIAGDVDRSC